MFKDLSFLWLRSMVNRQADRGRQWLCAIMMFGCFLFTCLFHSWSEHARDSVCVPSCCQLSKLAFAEFGVRRHRRRQDWQNSYLSTLFTHSPSHFHWHFHWHSPSHTASRKNAEHMCSASFLLLADSFIVFLVYLANEKLQVIESLWPWLVCRVKERSSLFRGAICLLPFHSFYYFHFCAIFPRINLPWPSFNFSPN